MGADDEMTYEEFGRRFYEIAVTEERVGGAIGAIAGDEFVIGPIAQGPGKIAKVTAKVRIQDPMVKRAVGELITFSIRIPLEIDMVVDLRPGHDPARACPACRRPNGSRILEVGSWSSRV